MTKLNWQLRTNLVLRKLGAADRGSPQTDVAVPSSKPYTPGPQTPPATHAEATAQPAKVHDPPAEGIPDVLVEVECARAKQRVSTGRAILRYPFAFLLPILVFAVLGAFAGAAKHPSYTAIAQLYVNQPLGVTAAALPGVVQAGESVAATYAQAIGASQIVTPLANKLHIPAEAVRSRLSATSIPQSAVIRIAASGGTVAAAVSLANMAADQFASYASQLTNQNDAPSSVERQYRVAAIIAGNATAALQRLQTTQSKGGTVPLVELAQAVSAVDIAQLREHTLGDQYQTLVGSNANAPSVQLFIRARAGASNRRTNLERYTVVGAFVGTIVGAAFAAALANRRPTQR